MHDILIHKGYHVSIVGQPNTTLDENVAATRSIINAQDGAVVLVGHSSGGSVITIAGNRAKVTALVYVAALQPDIGESIDQLTASMPAPGNDIHSTRDGHLYFEQNKFGADFAGDLSSNRTDFMAVSQQFVSQEIFAAPVWESAWRSKPSYAIVAADDRVLNPDLQRRMYQRAGSIVTEIKGSHAVYISQPEAVASVIEAAAMSAQQ